MEINPQRPLRTSSANSSSKARAKKNAVSSETSPPEEGSVFVGSSLQLAIQEGLDALNEVRQTKVEDGRRLTQDPDYPAAEELDEVSRLAARHFRGEVD